MKQLVITSIAAVLLMTVGCQSHNRSPWQKYELYFGRSINGTAPPAIVSDQQWQQFVKTVIAPRFSGGFTILDAKGAWRGKDDKLIKELSKVLVIVTNSPDTNDKVEEIRNLYKQQFNQEAVMKILTPATVEF